MLSRPLCISLSLRQAVISANELKDYLGVSHPDRKRAECSARMVLENRVKNVFPKNLERRNDVQEPPSVAGPAYHVADEDDEDSDDDDDWYAEGVRVQQQSS